MQLAGFDKLENWKGTCNNNDYNQKDHTNDFKKFDKKTDIYLTSIFMQIRQDIDVTSH